MRQAHGKGTLTITTERREPSPGVAFRDDGPGIPPEICTSFSSLLHHQAAGSRAPGGSACGLSRSIVLEHGGDLNWQSQPGHGATFTIDLPIAEGSFTRLSAAACLLRLSPDRRRPEKAGYWWSTTNQGSRTGTKDADERRTFGGRSRRCRRSDARSRCRRTVRRDHVLTYRMPGIGGIGMYFARRGHSSGDGRPGGCS